MIKFNRILFTVLAFVLVLALASCGGEKLCEECVDKDGNGVCDVCKNEISKQRPQPMHLVSSITADTSSIREIALTGHW